MDTGKGNTTLDGPSRVLHREQMGLKSEKTAQVEGSQNRSCRCHEKLVPQQNCEV